MKRINPLAISTNPHNIIPSPITPKPRGITFSFEMYEKTEYFNLDVTCPSWSSELFDMLKDVSTKTKTELICQKNSTYRVHQHEGASSPSPFPANISPKDCYQIRLGKSKGGIHGIFVDEVFFVLWLDPLHNMYPDPKYGGLKRIKPPKTCCDYHNEEFEKMRLEIDRLKDDFKTMEEYAIEIEAKFTATK